VIAESSKSLEVPTSAEPQLEAGKKTFFILEAARFWPHALRKQKAGLLIRSWAARLAPDSKKPAPSLERVF